MSDYKVNVDLMDVEIDVKKAIENMDIEETNNLISDIFDDFEVEEKPKFVVGLFSSLTEQGQNKVLDDIISEQLSDEQFHTLTEYFKKHRR